MTRAIHRNSSPRGAVANCGVLVGFLFLFLIIVGLTDREELFGVASLLPLSVILLSSRSRPLLPFPERATANLKSVPCGRAGGQHKGRKEHTAAQWRAHGRPSTR